MDGGPASAARWLLDSERGAADRLIPRWLFLRALGLIYFSAFFSLVFQIRGLVGPDGILPAADYLEAVTNAYGAGRFWFAPTLLWFSSGNHMLMGICWVGLAASLLFTLNLWPRAMLGICFVCFLSFITAAGDFSSYQSDGMLLEAGFIGLFFAPPGLRPGMGHARPPSRASLFLLQWEWFRIYFESGVAKIQGGDPQWRHLTAMDEYYQNGPLPTWIGWFVQHLPHGFHVATAFGTLALELVIVWMLFLPRRARIVCFCIVTPWEIGVILTANYAFLNYLVLALGILLVDDRFLERFALRRAKLPIPVGAGAAPSPEEGPASQSWRADAWDFFRAPLIALRLSASGLLLGWIFYATTAQLVWMVSPATWLPVSPMTVLEPFRIANRYGLFGIMTRGRYEIEFQDSDDGVNWAAYPFRYKPQDTRSAPGIYAPYQPRFDWNLWFASLGQWQEYPLVTSTEVRLLEGQADVLALFAGNPFAGKPPRQVRAVIWQYWFTSMEEKRTQGVWWRRQLLGLYAPALQREPDGRILVVERPQPLPPRE
jgi:lipase maturation factor 1